MILWSFNSSVGRAMDLAFFPWICPVLGSRGTTILCTVTVEDFVMYSTCGFVRNMFTSFNASCQEQKYKTMLPVMITCTSCVDLNFHDILLAVSNIEVSLSNVEQVHKQYTNCFLAISVLCVQ